VERGKNEKCTQHSGPRTLRKKPFGRYRRTWEDNIKMSVRKIIWEDVEWIHLVQDRDQY